MPKNVWGIELRSEVLPPGTPKEVEEFLMEIRHSITFETVIVRGDSAGKMFVSTPEIRRHVEAHPELKNRRIGFVDYEVFPKKSLVVHRSLFPFQYLGEEEFKFFAGKGIASEIQRAVNRELIKRYPKFCHQEGEVAIGGTMEMHRRRGTRPGQVMPLSKRLKMLQNKTRVWQKRRRLK